MIDSKVPSRSLAEFSAENQAYFDRRYTYLPAPPPKTQLPPWLRAQPPPGAASEVLGTGDHAVVKYARHDSGRTVAVKEQWGDVNGVRNEINVMRGVKSPHVIKLHEAIFAEDYDGARKTYLVMEHAPLRLEKELEHGMDLEEKQVWAILAGVYYGTKAIHDVGMIHDDIDVRNVLVGADGKAKLSDLSECKPISKENPTGRDARQIRLLAAVLFDAVGKDNLSSHAKRYLQRREELLENRDVTASMFALHISIARANGMNTKTKL